MVRTFPRLAAALLLSMTLMPVAGVAETGSKVTLNTLPRYIGRVFFPVVPRTENRLQIADLLAESVVQSPADALHVRSLRRCVPAKTSVAQAPRHRPKLRAHV